VKIFPILSHGEAELRERNGNGQSNHLPTNYKKMFLIEILREKLAKGIVNFSYVKKDGSLRNACGTLFGIGHTIKGTGKGRTCPYTLSYYDVDCKGWRSFIIENLREVGEMRKGTIEEHHDICLALVVKLKQKMEEEGTTAFAYRKADGSIRYAHGYLIEPINLDSGLFVYFDTDKGKKRQFRIDSFIGFGEFGEIDEMAAVSFHESSRQESRCSSSRSYNDFSTLDIKTILAKKGIDIEDTENFMVIDLLPELNKEQLKDLICKAAARLAEL
jgi:hypothetical protein